jgi:hypothetical protein
MNAAAAKSAVSALGSPIGRISHWPNIIAAKFRWAAVRLIESPIQTLITERLLRFRDGVIEDIAKGVIPVPASPSPEIEITPEMIEAATKVLHESGIVEFPTPSDECPVKRMLEAALVARKSSSQTRKDGG